MVELVADVVGLVPGLGEDKATLIGHDWGAPIVWNSALLRPDLFRGVAGLSVPYHARSRVKPTDGFRRMGGDDEFYILYFQEPGRAEAEIEKDVRQWLLGFYFTASGEDRPSDKPPMAAVSPGGELRDRFHYPDEMPTWLNEADLDFYSSEFERSGFAGGLNRYRNVDRDCDEAAGEGNGADQQSSDDRVRDDTLWRQARSVVGQVLGGSDQRRSTTAKTIEQRNHLRHRSHLDALREHETDPRTEGMEVKRGAAPNDGANRRHKPVFARARPESHLFSALEGCVQLEK